MIPILPAELDRDPWQFNVMNGTVDLHTGQRRAHRPEDYLTKVAPVTFDPSAKCPIWDSFLSTIMPSKNIVAYLQRLAGYWLTGRTTEHVLPILWGVGANGKSTFINTIFAVLGSDYSGKASRDLLIAARGEKHPTALAWLHGKRFICAIETADGAKLDEALVKELTGGDPITARRMREDFWTFDPTHKVALVTNHKPQVRGTDYAMWRRLRLIPFNVTIPPGQQDKNLPDKLRSELPGILNWMLAGCVQWQQGGMAEPSDVLSATNDYQSEQDKLGAFITERCKLGNSLKTPVTAFYAAYKDWCKANGEPEANSTAFGSAMSERSITKDKGRRHYLGIRLREPTDQGEAEKPDG